MSENKSVSDKAEHSGAVKSDLFIGSYNLWACSSATGESQRVDKRATFNRWDVLLRTAPCRSDLECAWKVLSDVMTDAHRLTVHAEIPEHANAISEGLSGEKTKSVRFTKADEAAYHHPSSQTHGSKISIFICTHSELPNIKSQCKYALNIFTCTFSEMWAISISTGSFRPRMDKFPTLLATT